MRKPVIAFAFAAAAALPAYANDTTAELSTGGLLFVQNENVEMLAEDLSISTKQISVRYRFFNKSPEDVTVLVAFPLPEIRVEEQDQNLAIPSDDPVNPFGFATTVNGTPVKMQVEQRVTAAGIDRTQLLRSLGIPLAPQLPGTVEALDRLPPEKQEELLRLGLAEADEYDVGRGMEKHLEPRWGLHTTFFWEQTFPARSETLIEHHYEPSVGRSVQTSLGSPGAARESWFAEYKEKYCLDNAFLAAVERARRESKSDYGAPFSEERIAYVLRTGANWSGSIGSFHLVVDKGDPSNLVSFCGEGVKKISDTKFEMSKTDYTPEGDLSVLILKKLPSQ